MTLMVRTIPPYTPSLLRRMAVAVGHITPRTTIMATVCWMARHCRSHIMRHWTASGKCCSMASTPYHIIPFSSLPCLRHRHVNKSHGSQCHKHTHTYITTTMRDTQVTWQAWRWSASVSRTYTARQRREWCHITTVTLLFTRHQECIIRYWRH